MHALSAYSLIYPALPSLPHSAYLSFMRTYASPEPLFEEGDIKVSPHTLYH
jgi:hypothetical protein